MGTNHGQAGARYAAAMPVNAFTSVHRSGGRMVPVMTHQWRDLIAGMGGE